MSRLERRLFKIADEIARIDEEIRLTAEELAVLRHLDDDAQRDAAVGGPLERDDARVTSGDVARFEEALDRLRGQRDRLDEKRARLLDRLG